MPVSATGELFIDTFAIVMGFSLFSAAFVADIVQNLRTLSEEMKNERRSEMERRFFNIIKFHSKANQLSEWPLLLSSLIYF